MPIVLDGTQGISTPMYAGSISSNPVTPSVNMKNRIINGSMVIDQRNAGASVTPSNSYALDRWICSTSQASKYTVQQNAGSVTPRLALITDRMELNYSFANAIYSLLKAQRIVMDTLGLVLVNVFQQLTLIHLFFFQ